MIQLLKDLFTTKPKFKVGDLICFKTETEREYFETPQNLAKITHVGKNKYGIVYHYNRDVFGTSVYTKDFASLESIYDIYQGGSK